MDALLPVDTPVYVDDPGLEQLRNTYAAITGSPAPDNHHGFIAEVWGAEGLYLVQFNDGVSAPYSFEEVHPL